MKCWKKEEENNNKKTQVIDTQNKFLLGDCENLFNHHNVFKGNSENGKVRMQ